LRREICCNARRFCCSCLTERRKRFRKRRESPLKGSLRHGDDQPVIRDGHMLSLALVNAAHHFLPVPHACAAVNHQLVGREILRKIAAFHVRKFKLAAYVLLEPARNLYAPDVLFNGMVRACLCDQDSVAGRKFINGKSRLGLRDQVSLQPRKQN